MADETKLIEVAAYGSLVPYWAFSLATAGSFYAGTRWIGAHFKPELKSKLTQWLNGTYEDTWTAQFGRLFDTVFGEKHFSWQRLYRSAVASVLSVIFLYVLFAHVLGVMGERSFGALPFWQVLLLGTAINIIPDYLSLIETRWVLHRFERVRSFPLQIVLLLVDLVFTAAIIFGAIYLYALIFVEGRPPSWVELVALFSPLAVLFYSTFLTSVWAWLNCLSTWFIRLFTKLGLRRVLDVKADPVKQIALVGSVFVLVGGLALGPAVNPQKGGFVSSFDEMVCEWDFGACVHAARISVRDPETAVRAAHFMALACRDEADEGSCAVRLDEYFEADPSEINKIWETACEAGLARACSALGYAYNFGQGLDVDLPRAARLYDRACEAGNMLGCFNLGEMYRVGESGGIDILRAVSLYDRACDGGYMPGCNNLGWMLHNGPGLAVEIDLVRAASLYDRACNGGELRGCSNLAEMYRKGHNFEANFARAFDLHDLACKGGDMFGCLNLGRMYQAGDGVTINLPHAVNLYQRACNGGELRGCNYLGLVYEKGNGIDVDLRHALSLYQQACEGDVSIACENEETLRARLDK